MREVSEEDAIRQVIERLTKVFPTLPPQQVAGAVHNAHRIFHGSRVRDFVPLLVERVAYGKLCLCCAPAATRPCRPDHIVERV